MKVSDKGDSIVQSHSGSPTWNANTVYRDALMSADAIDANHFRDVLSFFPTGVVLVTGLDEQRRPVGMVVGSFTSVSLEPPLVAFLPTQSSSTYKKFDFQYGFLINFLGSDQEDLCRRFAMKNISDKWDGVAWEEAERGLPLITDAIAWVSCELEAIHPAGDHDIVVGRVGALDVQRPRLPLVFFQGGYGKFSSVSIHAPVEPDLIRQLRVADLATSEIRSIAEDLNVECMAQAAVGGHLIHIASAGTSWDRPMRTRVGTRVPFMPPFGGLQVAWSGPKAIEKWIDRLGPELPEGRRERFTESLELIRERGYSISLGGTSAPSAGAEISRFTSEAPSKVSDELLLLMDRLSDSYEPADLESSERLEIRSIGAPIFGPDGEVQLTLKLLGLPESLSKKEIEKYRDRLLQGCRKVEQLLD